MLTSGKVIRDPQPYVYPDAGWRVTSGELRSMFPEADGHKLLYLPRTAEFGVNPILFAMRSDLSTVKRWDRREDYPPQDRNLRGVAERWAWYLEQGEHDVSWNPRHLNHAARVIGKLLGTEVVAKSAVMG